MAPLENVLWRINLRIVVGGALAALFTVAASLLLARRINRALDTIKQGAERFARGDFSQRLSIPDAFETATLAEAINEMAAQLHGRIRNEVQQRSEQEAVLSSMVEGVFAVDTEQNVISLNKAAAQLFGINGPGAAGRGLEEVVRNPALHRFVAEALRNSQPVESEIVLTDPSEQVLQANGTVLRDAQGQDIGAVIVLNDVTSLRRLERIRRDFVANVSHELRTPITSIKGFVETLLDGALQDPEEATHFLEIVGKQADRLNAIIEDLLTLSRVEQEAEKAEIAMRPGKIRDVLKAAAELCAPSASAKGIAIDLQCAEELHAYISAPLLEQAVVNLLDNAIKYSEPKSSVVVAAYARANAVAIEVRDCGCGIPAEHLPRLFERFYRVDKARSRQLGGTGLGLAIVKHIAQTHEGQVFVESKPGRGTLFTILLPFREGHVKAKPDGQEYS